uniref:beta-N-acetylhexosaminidase n=1 Tax=Angiostrongylus cantonensis TaxID=6313 RepID=A0A0K0CXD2_ANGCA
MFYENIIVHFDLKGAPPRLPYFLELLDTVAKSGATGIMIEWEDMFPWMGQLSIARNTDAYSLDDVRKILGRARDLNLEVIPLVQTFGHLEWILKLEQFRKYRENDEYPQVLCLGDKEGVEIVKDALKQVIDVHKPFGIKYFHIGSDEAFEFGVCQKSVEWISTYAIGGDKQLLALSHMKDIALFVKKLTEGTTVLAWHDMLKDFDSYLVANLKLGEIIEPVIWDYSENIVTMTDSAFSDLASNFPIVWASSAYKGANFPSAKYIDIGHYEANNLAWIDTKIAQEPKFAKFHGIIITGWQR